MSAKNNLKYQAMQWDFELTTRVAGLARVANNAHKSFSKTSKYARALQRAT
jgi:hypothetical protein